MRKRDVNRSMADILNAAEQEFSEKGFYGTRVDEISEKANINKGMIYKYFGSKELLYREVLITVYGRIGQQEHLLLSEEGSCVERIRGIIAFYFSFLQQNPTYVNLLMWENLNKGRSIESIDLATLRNPAMGLLREILHDGIQNGEFRADIDPEQIIYSILIYTYANFTNQYTFSKMIGKNFADPANMEKRVTDLTQMLLEYISTK